MRRKRTSVGETVLEGTEVYSEENSVEETHDLISATVPAGKA